MLENFKFIIDQFLYFLLRLTKVQHYYSNRNAFKLVFSAKICFKVVVGGVKLGKPYFSLSIPTIKYYRT